MSFSSDAREELARQPLEKNCCMLAELSALTQTTAHLSFQGGGRVNVVYQVESAALARRIFTMLKRSLSLSPQLHFVQHARLGGRTSSVLTLENEDAAALLCALNMMERDAEGITALKHTTPRPNITKQCCRRAFLRGAFLGAGSMTSPEKSYHLEIVAEDERFCQLVERMLERSGLPGRHSLRKGKQVVYLKGAQQIADMLALMGASGAVMELENIRIMHQMRGDINRASNCDDHNDERAAAASDQQVEAIKLIAIHRGLDSLPRALRDMAKLRLENPELSMQALGQLLDPPLGKSGVSHRLTRLQEIARQIEEAAEEGQMPTEA